MPTIRLEIVFKELGHPEKEGFQGGLIGFQITGGDEGRVVGAGELCD